MSFDINHNSLMLILLVHVVGSYWCPWYGEISNEFHETFSHWHQEGPPEEWISCGNGGCWEAQLFVNNNSHVYMLYFKKTCYTYILDSCVCAVDVKKWESSSWGRNFIVQKRRASHNDFDRFNLMLVKIKVSNAYIWWNYSCESVSRSWNNFHVA